MPEYTRRRLVATGLGAAAIGSAAGCVATDPNPGTDDDAENTTDADVENETPTDGKRTEYSVYMEPAGEISFERVPETWLSYHAMYGDMGIALGQADGYQAVLRRFYAENANEIYYSQLPGFSFDPDDLVSLVGSGSWDLELFYELDCDVHLMDERQMSRSVDVEEVVETVGPFAGNYIRTAGGDFYRQYYTLYEAFEKVAEVFQQRERYDAFETLHESVLADVERKLPTPDERPSVGVMPIGADTESGEMVGFPIDAGVGKKHYRDLGVKDAFAGVDRTFVSGNRVLQFDYEGLLEVDPDVIVVQFGIYQTEAEFERNFREPMRSHPVGREISAVRNDRIYRGGSGYQGPIMNLFNTEATAKQLYPDVFGEFEAWGETPSEPLFDRQHVSDIVTGNW
ncbi:ABC transporter substrate-binding protein [Haloferacaceae archaeon DSL9]